MLLVHNSYRLKSLGLMKFFFFFWNWNYCSNLFDHFCINANSSSKLCVFVCVRVDGGIFK